jgi:uncharacterized protein (DUF885 family)
MGLTRRDAMTTLCATVAIGHAPSATIAAAAAATAVGATKRAPPCPVATPINAVTEILLAHLPESATYVGTAGALDGGPLARRMDDRSPEGEAHWRAALAEARDALAMQSCGTGGEGALRLDVARAVIDNGLRAADIPYGRPNPLWFTGHAPYVVTPVGGPHIDTPNVMAAQQSLASPAAVDAWIEKLDGFTTGFEAAIAKMRADAAAGCRPPAELLTGSRPTLDAFLAGDARQHPLIVALRRRMAAAALDGKLRATAEDRAVTALEKRARPAFAALRAEIDAMLPRAREDAGIWAQPRGDELYAANMRTLGDTTATAEAIHRIGRDETARITAKMDALLRRRGLTRGSVGARMNALRLDPRNRFSDDDAGRAAAMDQVRALIRAMERRQAALLPAALIPRQPVEVRRVPVASEAGAPAAYYDGPALDGTRPGIFWINLRDMAALPRFTLPTLTYHEAVPGHHSQTAIATALPDMPLLLRIASFNAYSEGWALYVEQLAQELGLYRRDPLGDLGRLQKDLFRAVRLTVDTGLHALRWSRERAVTTLIEATGLSPGQAYAEVVRYMSVPGQALGYKLGQLRLLELRAAERRRLGKRFDLRAFHGAVLGHGPMPFDLVARVLGMAKRSGGAPRGTPPQG